MSRPAMPSSRRLRLIVSVVAFQFVALTIYRAIFLAFFGSTEPATTRDSIVRALSLGVRFDLRLALMLTVPLLALSWVPILDPLRSVVARTTWWCALVAAWSLVTLAFAVDLGHYAYLHSRLDATIVEHFAAPGIALRMVWETYPVVWSLLGIAVIVAGYGRVMWWVLSRRPGGRPFPSTRPARGALWTLTCALFLFGMYGSTSRFPLRWSDAYFSTSPLASALALNPVLHLVDTWENRRPSVDIETVRETYPDLAAFLGVEQPDPVRLGLARHVPAREVPGAPPNVVIVLLESFAGYKVGALGNPLDPTPHTDALARESWLFTNFFAVTSPTARAVFTAVTGIPDVNDPHSSSRNPLIVRQQSLVNAFEGYEKMYFLGGNASWGNISGFLAHSIPGIRILEEDDFDSPRVDGWGISDLDLMREAHAVFLRTEQPFVAIIQTSGNHRPWTIPEDHGDFALRDVDIETLNQNGFDSLEEFNSFRWMDHAVGELAALSQASDYGRNTILFLFGDHGSAHPRDVSWERLGLTHVHTPLLIHGPRLLGEPRVVDSVMSSLDVLPTALGLAGIGYENSTLGRDAFDGRPESGRFAFIRKVPFVGLVGREFLLKLYPDGATELFKHVSAEPTREVSAEFPDVSEHLGRLARGFHQTALYLLHLDEDDA